MQNCGSFGLKLREFLYEKAALFLRYPHTSDYQTLTLLFPNSRFDSGFIDTILSKP